MPRVYPPMLRQLAGLYGVQTAYYDTRGQRQQASPEALLAVLRLLGAPIETASDVPAAYRQRQHALWQRCTEPVAVLWSAEPAAIDLRLPADRARGRLRYRLTFEAGEMQPHTAELDCLAVMQRAEVEGHEYVVKRLLLPGPLPPGYHRLELDTPGTSWETLLVSAPRQVYTPPMADTGRQWGVFLPLYALHSQRSWGGGDVTDLEALTAWTAEQGGSLVATLPLMSSFLDDPYDPSPYAPVSRLFWNELYVDVTRAPELQDSPEAQALLHSEAFQGQIAALQAAQRVDYRQQMRLKRQVLEALAGRFFSDPAPARQAAFERFVVAHPAVEDYACFRATGERRRASWMTWPSPLRDGVLQPGDYDATAQQYHLYSQWLASEQFTALAEGGRAAGVSLYLDLPLGVHPDGYDVWRHRDAFVLGAAAGAPPDTFFTGGQNWGFPPLHPEVVRTQGYQYPIAFMRHQLTHAGMLRFDHVMGLHRLFWVPHGLEARQGVYVRYPAEELYAIVSLESHRHQARIVGENLGTVPSYVNSAMARHDLYGMYVLQYMLRPGTHRPLRTIPAHVVASLNTHDVFPFAAFWDGLDIADWRALGLANDTETEAAQHQRRLAKEALEHFLHQHGWLSSTGGDVSDVLRGCLAYLAASRAQILLVNLEDLWQERQPQNVPGTLHERPNWQRKARYAFEAFRQLPQVRETLQDIHRRRHRQGGNT